jgi:hypothetical protein
MQKRRFMNHFKKFIMTKRTIACLLVFFASISSEAQIDAFGREIRDNINYFRRSTLSFGVDTIATFQDVDGRMVTKKIFLPVGTGVLFYILIRKQVVGCIVTAKHVLRDSLNGWMPKKLRVRYSHSDSLPIDQYLGDELPLFGDLNLPAWFEHPDPTVDLAAILAPFATDTTRRQILPYGTMPQDDEYYEGKEVFVLGYPGSVGVDLLNKAVVRRGIISWVPTDINKSGKKILIDCSIFPGNSGGPVFSLPKNVGVILDDTVLNRPKFYGIVSQRRFSNNFIYSNGRRVLDSAGNPINSIESIGIGVIITAKKVRELLDLAQKDADKFIEEMDKLEKDKKKN